MPLAPEDEAGAAELGIAAETNRLIIPLAIDTPRAVLIATINKLVAEVNRLSQL